MNNARLLVITIYMVLGAALGVIIMPEIVRDTPLSDYPFLSNPYLAGIIGIVLFFILFGLLINKITYMINELEQFIMRKSVVEIFFATIGLVIGLFISVMLSFILQIVGSTTFNHFIPIIITLILSYLGFQFGLRKRDEMLRLLPENMTRAMSLNAISADPKIVDTSALIDGRIADVLACGFMDGEILIPQGVINELQMVADANDSVKRDKGQRGLDILNRLYDMDYPTRIIYPQKSHSDIDALLIKLAKHYNAQIITTDFNLNKVSHVHGVDVLNVNDLSDALKPTVHQGDRFTLLLTKTGKESGQAVGYLSDGTMVVVDDAKQYIGDRVCLEVMSLLQTSSGRIVFAKKVEF